MLSSVQTVQCLLSACRRIHNSEGIVTPNPADLFLCGKRVEQRTILNDVQKLLNDEANVCLPVYRTGHQKNLMECTIN